MTSYTYDEALEVQGLGSVHLRVFLAAGFAYASNGAETMIMSVLSSWIQCEFRATTMHTAVMNSLLFIGCMIGATLKGIISDYYGRQQIISLYLWSCCLFSLLYGLAPNLTWVLVLRFMLGFTTGGITVDYAIEFFPKRSRKLTVLIREFWAIGTMAAQLIAGLVAGNFDWRKVVIYIAIMPFLSACVFITVPESPRYLLAHNRKAEASRILKKMAPSRERHVSVNNIVMCNSVTEKGSKQSCLVTMFSKEYRLVTCLLFLCRFAQGFLMYGLTILSVSYFKALDFSENTISNFRCSDCQPLSNYYYQTQIIYGFGDVCGSLLVYFLVDRIGRVKVLISMFGLYFVCLLPLMFIGHDILAVILITVARLAASAAGGALTQYVLETYPTVIRGTSFALIANARLLGDCVSPFVAEVLISINTSLPIILLSVTSMIAFISCVFLPFETKDKDLKDY